MPHPQASFERLSPGALEALKIRVLDSLGCAVGALEGGPVRRIRDEIEEISEGGRVTLIGNWFDFRTPFDNLGQYS